MPEAPRHRQTFFRLLGFLRPYKVSLAISTVFAIGYQASQIALVWLTKNVIDDALAPRLVTGFGGLGQAEVAAETDRVAGYVERVVQALREHSEAMVVIPGNHDSRNVGYVHFEEMFGDRNSVMRVNGVTIVAVD